MADVKAFFDNLEDSIFDIRQTKYVRFVDQKCTPDIVCFVADCILTTECATRPFTKSDLWHTNYFKEFTRVVYGKPYADNKGAAKEYDKIASQPLAEGRTAGKAQGRSAQGQQAQAAQTQGRAAEGRTA